MAKMPTPAGAPPSMAPTARRPSNATPAAPMRRVEASGIRHTLQNVDRTATRRTLHRYLAAKRPTGRRRSSGATPGPRSQGPLHLQSILTGLRLARRRTAPLGVEAGDSGGEAADA